MLLMFESLLAMMLHTFHALQRLVSAKMSHDT